LAKNSYELSSLEQHHKIAKDQKKATNLQMFWESCTVLATYMMNALAKNGYF
jgi:hypothetical protein